MVDKPEVKDEFSDEALDEWYGEEDVEQDQTAVETADEVTAASTAETTDTAETPVQEAQTSDPVPTGADDGTSLAPPKAVDPYDWIEGLDPEVKAQAEALARRDQSNAGRVAATQRRLDEANAQLEAQRIASTQARSTNKGTSKDAKTEETDPALAEFAEEFPTVHENIQRMNQAERQRIRDEIMEEVRPIKEAAAKQRILQEREVLRHGFSQLFNTHETGLQLEDVIQSDEWKSWLAHQPPEYQQFVKSSNSAPAALKALEDFARYEENIVFQEWVDAGMPDQQNPAQPNDADRVAAQRGDALQGAAPDSRSAAVTSSKNAASYEQYFDEAVDAG